MSVFDYLACHIDINDSFFFQSNIKQSIDTEIFSFRMKENGKEVCYQALYTNENKISLRKVFNGNKKHFKKIGNFTIDGLNLKFKSIVRHNHKLNSDFSIFSEAESKKMITDILNHMIKEYFNPIIQIHELKIMIDFLYKLKLSSFYIIKSEDSVDYPSEMLFLIISKEKQYLLFEKQNVILEYSFLNKELKLSKFQVVIKYSKYNKEITKTKLVNDEKVDNLNILMYDFLIDTSDYFLNLYSLNRKISYYYDTTLKGLL